MNNRLIAAAISGIIAMSLTVTTFAQGVPATPGQIRAVRVVGEVSVTHGADKTAIAVHDDDSLAQGDVVTTAKASSVVLVFSNGSTLSIGQSSRLAIDQFLQDPFGQNVKVAELEAEPSTSHTKLNLAYGELVGNVKKLQGASSFLVQTPVGAAGIRGTTFRLVYRPAGNGLAFFTISMASGEIMFQGITGVPVPIPAGQEAVVEATVNSATGAVESINVSSHGIPPETQQLIEQQVAQTLQAIKDLTFSSGFGSPNGPQPPPPPPPQDSPRTTPGDGQAG